MKKLVIACALALSLACVPAAAFAGALTMPSWPSVGLDRLAPLYALLHRAAPEATPTTPCPENGIDCPRHGDACPNGACPADGTACPRQGEACPNGACPTDGLNCPRHGDACPNAAVVPQGGTDDRADDTSNGWTRPRSGHHGNGYGHSNGCGHGCGNGAGHGCRR